MWLILIPFWLFCAFAAAGIAKGKRRSVDGWFIAGLLFGPFAWIVAALPPLPAKASTADLIARHRRQQAQQAAKDRALVVPGRKASAPAAPGPKRFTE